MKRLLFFIFAVLTLPAQASYLPVSLLAVVKGVNLNTTNDQSLPMRSSKYVIRRVVVVNASASPTLAVGGFYTAASKGGTAIIANTQVYTVLTATTKWVDMTLATILTTDVRTETTLYFALTTAQGSACTADIYIFGDPLD